MTDEKKTALEQIDDLYKIAEYIGDPELITALEFVAKAIIKPEIPHAVIVVELVRLQAIAMKLALRATWLANVEKDDRAKKNLYYTAADQLNLFCQTLKYSIRS